MNYITTTGNNIELNSNPDSCFETMDIDINIKISLPSESYANNVSPCDSCSNSPKNGGNGICCCTLGSPRITC
jgi:hypothetical protein